MDYRLYRLETLRDPDELLLDYGWSSSLDNTEWRPCVEHFLSEVASQGHNVVALPSPAFECGEDFVKIAYLVDGRRVTFSSDILFSHIVIKSEDPYLIRDVWNHIGNKVGWFD